MGATDPLNVGSEVFSSEEEMQLNATGSNRSPKRAANIGALKFVVQVWRNLFLPFTLGP